MTYGLKATTANDQLIIDGGSSRYRGFQVITARTDTANSSFSNLSYNSGDLVFAQRTTTGAIGADLPSSTDNVGISHYFVARVANGFSANQRSGTYGLQVKNQSGQVAFDSRNSVGGSFIGFSIERVYPPGTLTGQTSAGSASTTTGSVMISNIDPSDYYLLVIGSLYSVSTQSTQGVNSTLNWGGAYYDYTNNLIRYIGLVEIGTNPPPIISNVNIPFNNLNTVVLAKYIT